MINVELHLEESFSQPPARTSVQLGPCRVYRFYKRDEGMSVEGITDRGFNYRENSFAGEFSKPDVREGDGANYDEYKQVEIPLMDGLSGREAEARLTATIRRRDRGAGRSYDFPVHGSLARRDDFRGRETEHVRLGMRHTGSVHKVPEFEFALEATNVEQPVEITARVR